MDGTILRAAGSRHKVRAVAELEKKLTKASGPQRCAAAASPTPGALSVLSESECKALAYGRRGELKQVCMTEMSAHLMPQKDGGYAPGYNIQWSNESSFGLVMGVRVLTTASDGGQLKPDVMDVQASYPGLTVKKVSSDTGYYDGGDIAYLQGEDIKTFVTESRKRQAPGIATAYQAEHFVYDEALDGFICPEGKLLAKKRKCSPEAYQYFGAPCQSCPVKSLCCQDGKVGANGRSIRRSIFVLELERNRAWVASVEGQQQRRLRAILAEGVTARVKERFGVRKLRPWGLEHVRSQAWLLAAAFNVLIASGVWKPMVASG